MKSMKIATFSAPLVELEPHEAAIANGGDHARRELLSGLRQDSESVLLARKPWPI